VLLLTYIGKGRVSVSNETVRAALHRWVRGLDDVRKVRLACLPAVSFAVPADHVVMPQNATRPSFCSIPRRRAGTTIVRALA
jgi:hypothetical protein